MLDFNKNDKCTGCTACASACPKNAITMRSSDRGFFVPEINEEICISCGKCETVCPVIANGRNEKTEHEFKECYYLYDNDKDIQKSSTSGGVFYRLASNVISHGGVVCGCIWDEDFQAIHICSDDISIIRKMQGSKYVQSNMVEIFKEIREIVKTREVLFVGTPCQATGLHKIIGNTKNLLICALVFCLF